jgi:hypothetical protein
MSSWQSVLWTVVCCILAIVGCKNNNGNNNRFVSAVRAESSGSKKGSIPSQILGAKVPAPESNLQQQQQQQQQQQLWLYEGALYDPLDGRRVAKVRGLELIRPLEDTSQLAIDSLLKHPNATYEDSKTVWSQKIFCYTTTRDVVTATDEVEDPQQQQQPQQQPQTQESILNSVRVRPRSPRKEVPLDQAVAVYETATTFVSRRKKKGGKRQTSTNGGDDDEDENDEVLVHSEWPNGQTMWGETRDCSHQREASRRSSSSSSSIDFTIFAKLRNKNSPLYAPDLLRDESEDDEKGSGDIIVSPKRAALVQFGSADGTMETKHKFGARETYSYRNVPIATTTKNTKKKRFSFRKKKREASSGSPTLYYTRYGEGPPFYAPGRMCMLELKGRPVNSLSEVGPLLRGLVLGGDINSDGDIDSDSDGKRSNSSPSPVANFHWRETSGETEGVNNKDNNNNRKSRSSGGTSNTSDHSPISIQTAWNLRDRERKQSFSVGVKSRETPMSSRDNNQRRQQPLVLKLVEDTTSWDQQQHENGVKWKGLARKGRNRAMVVWDRIKASTSMEARS